MDALAFHDVHKQYGRRGTRALDGLTCRFPMGSITGLVGPNGAGKTTAFSVVSGFLSHDSGKVDVLGAEGFDAARLKGRLGVLPQDAELGYRHTPRQLLRHLAGLQGLRRTEARSETDRVLDAVRLTDRRNKPIISLSHGMRRRVAVASALLGTPELVLLDEPMAGLDPLQAHSLRDVLRELRGKQTLVVSSHNLDELERLCDWVVMLDAGRCIAEGPIDEVTGQTEVVEWTLSPGEVPLEALRRALPDHTLRVHGSTITQTAPASSDLDASALIVTRILTDHEVAIREVRRGVSLEQRFMDETGQAS